MLLFREDGQKVRYNISSKNRIGGGLFGDVYWTSELECTKIYKPSNERIDLNILMFIKELKLKSFYEIHELLYGKNGFFKGHTMKYYQSEEVDILTMPVTYTLDNFYSLYESVCKLTASNIFISDMHTGNIIMSQNGITAIDVDLYTFNRFYTSQSLKTKNNLALNYLFSEIYLEALASFHREYSSYSTRTVINSLYNNGKAEDVCKKLIKYKYPIDYIKRNIG